MPNAVFGVLLAVTLSAQPGAAHPKVHREHPTARGATVSANRLFALRERRRIAAYLRMRLLEMREEGLGRAADAVKRRLPPDVLEGSP